MTDTPPEATPQPPTPWGRYIVLLSVSMLALALVLYLVFRPGSTERGVVEEVLQGDEAAEIDVNRAQVIETAGRRDIQAREGYRYRVVVVDEAREGAAGIARIGGLVTFIDGARKGEHLVVEVTRVKRSTADAVIVKRLDQAPPRMPAEPDISPAELEQAATHGPVKAGSLYRAKITERGKRGDGVTRIDGMVVFVEGGEPGENVIFRVTDVAERFAKGTVVKRLAADVASPVDTPSPETTPEATTASPSDHGPVEVGRLYRAAITDTGKQGDGVAHIDGLVVFVQGASKGDTAVFKVTERADRFARAEFVRPAQPITATPRAETRAAAPAEKKPSKTNEVSGKAKADDVQAGAVFDVEIAEKDRNNPEQDGVTRIDGLVVFVPSTQPGDHVQIRITERRARIAKAEVVEPSGDAPEDEPHGESPE